MSIKEDTQIKSAQALEDGTRDYLFMCECGDSQDQIIMRLFVDDFSETNDNKNDLEEPCVYATFHLNKFPFWKRLKLGIKYIFGYGCKYGNFGEVIIKPTDYPKMQEITDYLKKAVKIQVERQNRFIEQQKIESSIEVPEN
jgi:hypothetical protein